VRGVWAYSDADWNNVQAEYIDLLSDDKLDDLFLLKRDINKLHNKIQLTQHCISALQVMYYEPLCAELNKMGYKVKFTPETIISDLKRVVTLAQSLVLQRDEKVKLYKEAESKLTGTGKAITEQDFDDNLVTLSKFQGYRLGKEVFLSEYIAVKNSFSEYVKANIKNGSRPN